MSSPFPEKHKVGCTIATDGSRKKPEGHQLQEIARASAGAALLSFSEEQDSGIEAAAIAECSIKRGQTVPRAEARAGVLAAESWELQPAQAVCSMAR